MSNHSAVQGEIKIFQKGFSLLMLSIWMIGLGLAAAITLTLLPNLDIDKKTQQTIQTLDDSRDNILGFIVENNRLPVPDTDNDGGENPGSTSGALPYRSMKLPIALNDAMSRPIRYAPYINGAINLTTNTQTYEPGLPDLMGHQGAFVDTTIANTVASGATPPKTAAFDYTVDTCAAQAIASPINILDFCAKLDNAIAAVGNSSAVNIGPSSTNVAYALLSGGLEDADGDASDASFDGDNDDGDLSFDDPARGREAGYDDLIRGIAFSNLKHELSCQVITDSVDLLAAVANSSNDIMGSAISAYNDAVVGYVMSEITVLLDIIAVLQSIQGITGVAADIGKSGGGCASIILSATCCPALAGNIAGAIVYGVTAAVQLAALVVDVVAAQENYDTVQYFRSTILPNTNAHLCSAIGETTAADTRGGLTGG